MKDSCDATERSYGLDRSVLSGPVAWAVTDNPCRVSDGGGAEWGRQEAQGSYIRV